MIFIMKQAGHVWGHPRSPASIMVVVPLKIWSDYYRRTNEIWYFARSTSPSFDEEISACLIHGLKARNRARRVEISSREVDRSKWCRRDGIGLWSVCNLSKYVCAINCLLVRKMLIRTNIFRSRIKSEEIEKYIIFINV